MERGEELAVQLGEMAQGIIERARRGELSAAYLEREGGAAEPVSDDLLAAAAIVEMCRQAFSGEWSKEGSEG